MYQVDTAEKWIAQIETSLKGLQTKLERDKSSTKELDWSHIKDLEHIATLLKLAERSYD